MTRWILIAAAALALPVGSESASAEAAELGVPAHPLSDPQSWIGGKDYPAAALRAGEQGTVRYVLDIGADGRVRGCRVTQSSNSASLDAATCRIMTARGRFRPAMDGERRPVRSEEVQAVAWSLPAEAQVVHWGYGVMVSISAPPPVAVVGKGPPIVREPIMAVPQDGAGEAELSVWTPGRDEIPTLGRYQSIPHCRIAMARLELSPGQKAYCTLAPKDHPGPAVH